LLILATRVLLDPQLKVDVTRHLNQSLKSIISVTNIERKLFYLIKSIHF